MNQAVTREDLRRARGDGKYLPDARAALLLDANPLAGLSLLLLVVVLAAGGFWAERAVLDEVTLAEGEVISSSREQVIQNLEGGILSELLVREGDIVEKGDVLLRIDDTRFGTSLRESQSREAALRAAVARLRAEAEGGELEFPGDLPSELVVTERNVFESRRAALDVAISNNFGFGGTNACLVLRRYS